MQFLSWIRVVMLVVALRAASGTVWAENGVMSLLMEPPFYGHFVRAEVRPQGCVAAITRDDGTTLEFQSFDGRKSEVAFLSRVKLGQRVAFPQCFFDLMDPELILESVRSQPGRSFTELLGVPAFRARVLDQAIGKLTYSIVLREAGGQVHHLHGMLGVGQNYHIAKLLKKGASYEFPAVFNEMGLSEQARRQQTIPVKHMNDVLWRYIGEWKGRTEAVSYATLRMRCYWDSAGDGIWREVTYEHGPDVTPPPADVSRVAYSGLGHHLAWNPGGQSLKLRVLWDELNKTFTTCMPADEEGVERFNTATFVDDDHIEWKTFSKLADGRVLEMNSGSYVRVSRDPEPALPEKEPRAIDVLAGTVYTFDDSIPADLLPGPSPVFNTSAPKLDPNRPDLPIFDKPSDAPVMEVVDATLAGLAAHPPFRARLISKTIQPHNLTLVLQHTGGHLQTIEDKGDKLAEKPEALALVSLKEGETHEFPDCLLPKGSQAPRTPAMQALAPLIGTWSKTLRTREGSLEPMPCLIRFFASADGAAFWHEEEMSGRQKLQRLSFDENEQVYVSALEHVQADPKAVQGRWDEKTRTYTQVRHFMNAPPGAVREESTLRIASADLIEWRTRRITQDESVVHESSGTLERVKP